MATAKKSIPGPASASAKRAAPSAPAAATPAGATEPKPKAAAAKSPPPATVPVPAAVAPEAVKAKRVKLVRDGFTIPKDEYLDLEALKTRVAALGSPSKKSELLRAGIKALAAMPDKALLAALSAVPSIKTGRPEKS